jgi:DNA-binding LacI/PurR family transcriptional regulator
VTLNSTLYGPAATLAALAQTAVVYGFTTSVQSVRTLEPAPIIEAVGRLVDERVAGLVVVAPVGTANAALDDIPEDIPLVTIDGDPSRGSELVTIDQEAGGYAATRHLLSAGHTTVWHVSGPPDWFDSQGRIAGWRRALAEADIEAPPLMPADWSAAAGYRAGELLARMHDVTAVFAANDHLALGVMLALHERGRRVPDDVSVVGFDDVPEAAYFIPPLTSVRPDFDAAAAASFDLLRQQIQAGTRVGTRCVIPPQLVSRRSVAPPAHVRALRVTPIPMDRIVPGPPSTVDSQPE